MTCRVLHVALEGGPASFGGLGNVVTQMYEAQNLFTIEQQLQFDASIITPLYPKLFKNYNEKVLVAEVEHMFNYEIITSKVYLVQRGKNKHYMIEPPSQYKNLFEINELQEIYTDTYSSYFIDRLKFFNSAVAAYVGNGIIGENHPNPEILQLHDWQASLVPVLLKDVYHNTTIKTAFMVHIDNYDRGSYPWYWLQGIGIDLDPKEENCILKAIGLMKADQIIVVSPRLLKECIESETDDHELEFLRKIYTLANAQGRAIGITNGINYYKYCPLGKLIHNLQDIHSEKQRIKHELATELRGSRSQWQFDPELPLILYVGRFAQEKVGDGFEQIIKDIDGRATFIAIGRSMTDNVYISILNHSRQSDNVFISFSEIEQSKFIEKMRAAADFVFVPSLREACGLVAPEGMANGAIGISTGVGGLRDVFSRLDFNDLDHISGNAIFYEVMPEGEPNPDLKRAIDTAINLWTTLNLEQRNSMQTRVMHEAQRFDWKAEGGSLHIYLNTFQEMLTLSTPKPRPRP